MKTKNRRGFTLVELLVVIAILAVLATVAILGYSAFTKKATISNDRAIVEQMNKALLAYETLDEKARYCDEAVNQCINEGFILENLTPSTSGFHFAYDQKYNRFMLLKEDHTFEYGDNNHTDVEVEPWNIFVVVGSQEEIDKATKEVDGKPRSFSIYAREEFDFEDNTNTVNVSAGFDVGKCTDVRKIDYFNDVAEQEVVIRTKGGELLVNGPLDTITHYDFATVVNVEDVKVGTYNEAGRVGRLIYDDDSGAIKFKSTAEVSCYMNISDDNKADASDTTKEEGSIVYTDVTSQEAQEARSKGEDEPYKTVESYGENAEILSKIDGTVRISKCTNHFGENNYDIEEVGNDKYVLCRSCGAYSKYDGTTSNGKPAETNIPQGDGTTAEEKVETDGTNGKITAEQPIIQITNVSTITLDKETATIEKDETISLHATIAPVDASIKDVIWSSLDSSIATVDENGVVKGIKSGNTTITVTSKADNSKYAICTITVTKKGESSIFTLPATYTIGDGETATLSSVQGLKWSTSDSSIVTVKNGVITAKGVGTAKISAGEKECVVTVKPFHYYNDATKNVYGQNYGDGSQTNKFMIVNVKQLANIGKNFDTYYYYEVDKNIKTIDCTLWSMIDFNGSIEGNNVTLDNLTDPLFDSYGVEEKVYVSNIKIKANIVKSSYAAALFYYCPVGELIVDNVDISGYIEGTYSSCYCAFGNAICDSSYNPIRYGFYTFKNCEGSATLVGTSNASGFIGHLYCKYSDGLSSNAIEKSLITIQDSKFIGKTYTPNTEGDTTAKYVAWNGRIACKFIYSANYDVTGLYGTLGTPNFDDGTYVCGNSIGWDFYLNTGKTHTLVTESKTAPEKGQIFEYDNTTLGADHAAISFIIAPNDKVTESGSFGFAYLEEEMTLVGNTFKSSLVKNYDVLINPDGVTAEEGMIYKITNNTINVVYPSYGHTHSGAYVQIKLYDSNDELLKTVSYHVANANALRVWYGLGYVKSAAVGGDYTYDTQDDLSGAQIEAAYYGSSTWDVIDSQYVHVNGSIITIDKEAIHTFTGDVFCIYIYDANEE